ncbi:hypothetical protein ACHWQZ_G011963 [Mnemiopsis leidyi]
MLLFESCCNISSTKLSRNLRPYRNLILVVLIVGVVCFSYFHIASLKDELLTRLNENPGTIDEVDLDSSLYDDGDKKGVDIQIKRNRIKQEDLMRRGGFAPIKKLKLTTDEPPVEIPDFFPKIEHNCKLSLKRVAGAWISHLRDPGDAQHRHRTDSWNLCFDEKLTRLNAFTPRGSGTSCVVYSFGMEDNWSFEEDMLLHNCEVHMFDSSKEKHSSVIKRKVRNLTIHRAVLSDHDEQKAAFIQGEEREKENLPPDKKTLSSIMEELSHTRVDVIKVDIEGEELGALEQASKSLVDGVDQILLEVHMHISEHAHDSAKPEHFEQATIDKWTKLFKSLRDDGYRVYDIRAKGTDRYGNIIPQHHYSCCYRLAMIKTPYRMKKVENIEDLSFDV